MARSTSPFLYFDSSPEVIRLVVPMYVRYPLSLRDVEHLLFERGIDIRHETVRLWRWHLDEMFVRIKGKQKYLWRAVDHEGEVLEPFITETRDKAAALKFIKKAMKRHGRTKAIVTDRLRSYGAALKEIGAADLQQTGRRLNNRAENSHLPFRRRERAMLRFRQMKTLQKFSAVHASFNNHFNQERHLVSRDEYQKRRSAALAEWKVIMA